MIYIRDMCSVCVYVYVCVCVELRAVILDFVI